MTSYEKMQKISLPVCHEGTATRSVSAHVPVDTSLDPGLPDARKKITCRFNGTNVTITNTELFDPFYQRYNVGRLVAVCPQHKLGHCGEGGGTGTASRVAVLQFENELDSNAKSRPGDNFGVTASQVRLNRRLTAINEESSGTRPNSVRVSIVGTGTGAAGIGNKTKVSRPVSGAASRPKSAAPSRPVSGKASGKTVGAATPRAATGTAGGTGTRSAKKSSDSPTAQKKTEKGATTNKTTDKTTDKPTDKTTDKTTDKPGGAKDDKTRKTTAPGTGTKATPKTAAAKSNADTPKSKATSTGKTAAIETK
eukprot:Selendium_serpulae@DN942_c0_g1_i1.p1